VGGAVEGFQFVDLAVAGGVFAVALGAIPGCVGDTVVGVGVGQEPADVLDFGHHDAAQLAHFVGVLELPEEEIALIGETALEFGGIVEGVIRDAKLTDILRHGKFLSQACAPDRSIIRIVRGEIRVQGYRL